MHSATKNEIYNFLIDLGRMYYALGEGTRAASFHGAAHSFKASFKSEVVTTESDLSGIPKVGKSTITEIHQFIERRTSDRHEELKVRINDTATAKNALQSSSDKLKNVMANIRAK